MLHRIPAFIRPRPFSGLPLSCGNREVSVAASVLPAAGSGAVRTENTIQRHFCTSRSICSKKDDQSVPANETSQKAAESQGEGKETLKKNLLDVIKDMKVQLNTANVKTTKPRGRQPPAHLETAVGRLQKALGEPPRKRNEFLSPELVAAASAVADSLPFDKQTTKSELLKQLQQHEEESRAQTDRQKRRVSFTQIISNMKIAKSPSMRVSSRPQHQIQFDEEVDSSLSQEKPADFRRRKCLFKGKRLSIFDVKAFDDEAPEPGLDDDGSEFHEHIFLEKHLEDFPKQGPIRLFMELVTCGLSKNPYLSVRQKVEHIEWFRNYFNEKRDILKENNIHLTS